MIVLLLITTLAAEEPYQWPLQLPRAITSSFAEYRAGRFHAGLDLRTGGIGPEVYAVAHGHVSRIRCSPWGYGKAVYVTGRDGNTTVYAHVADFSSSLREYVRKAQHERQDYSVDLLPEPGEFPIAQGELIAFAGRSGSSAPHLHWEIRDSASRPINPRLLGYSWPDDTRPVIRRVLVVPREGATVNGDTVPIVLETRAEGGTGAFASTPITAKGTIGVAVDVVDPANNGANVLGVHALTTTVNGKEVFRVQNDRLSYETMDDGRVSWHPYYASEGHFLLQWRWSGNASDNYSLSEGDGWIDVGSEPLDILVEARDFFDNAAVLPIRVDPELPYTETPPARGSDSAGRVDTDCFDEWLLISARFPDPEPETPALRCVGPVANNGVGFRRVSPSLFRASVAPAAEDGQLTMVVEHPRLTPYAETVEVFQRGRARVTRVGELVIRSDARSPYGTLYLRVSEEDVTTPESGLVALGKAYRFWPADAPLDVPLEISFPQPPGMTNPAQVHIYRKSGSAWARQQTDHTGGRLIVRADTLGVFAAMADTVAPTVSAVYPSETVTSTTDARPRIQARVTDNASGVAEVEITANGKWLLAEFDPYDSPSPTITWLRDEDLPAGDNDIVIRAVDAAGNITVLSRTVKVGKETTASP